GEVGQTHPDLQHQGGVISATSAKYSVTPVLRMRPDDPLWVTSFPPSRHVRFAPRADIRPMPAYMSTPHRAHVAGACIVSVKDRPTVRTRQQESGNPEGLRWFARSSSEQLASHNPMLALERGERVETPPTVWFQGRGDVLHDYKDADAGFPGNEPQGFVANYRKAGGEIALEYIDAARHAAHSPHLSKP